MSSPSHHADDHRRETIDAIWRMESARLIAALTRLLRGDVGMAEELAQDAFVSALEQWSGPDGLPQNPGAWLMAAAKNRAIDRIRRNRRFRGSHVVLARDLSDRQLEIDLQAVSRVDASLDDSVGDDLLRLVFMACHPVLPSESRAAITLRLLCGLTTDEIARAFLVPEPTIAQRIVRAKKTLVDKQVPFEVPRGNELAERLSSVLSVIYLLFNEGYSATAGDDWMRPALCEEALRLARIVTGLMPSEPEVHGLVALLEIQASRAKARVDSAGKPILLLEQNRALWDQLLIRRGLAALDRADALNRERGPYTLQAAIAACHARAIQAEDTDWPQISRLYGELALVSPSPIIELNRAVAVSMAEGPAAGLRLTDLLVNEPTLASYHLLPSVRGDLLFKLGRKTEAKQEFERAASLTRNIREQTLLLSRAAECHSRGDDPAT